MHIPVGQIDECEVLRLIKAQREMAHLGVYLRVRGRGRGGDRGS